jgi:hypothetical protein
LAPAALLALALAAPAGAVVGGQSVRESSVPWFASFAGCGGTLVAPDRIVTAAHCVHHLSPADLEHIDVGGTVRRGVRFALPPGWERMNGDNRLGGERLDAARMLCAIDVDGERPLSSACVGDSGGPLYAGSRRAPRVVGVVSWGGARCGADRLASVFAEADRYAAFATAPAPVWARWPTARRRSPATRVSAARSVAPCRRGACRRTPSRSCGRGCPGAA